MTKIKIISISETIKDLEILIQQTQDELVTQLEFDDSGAVSKELLQIHIQHLLIAKANLESVIKTGGVDETHTLIH